ncbi:MAG: GNAT family N-acetyltransferase [Clostridiaceae bacterium]|nr:GNAT family N-acetyltransferase [Clostridiaceae bacterium]
MIELHPTQYGIAARLVRGCEEELSIAATLGGWNPGQVLVDSVTSPHAAVIRATETTAIAGDASYTPAYEDIRRTLRFMESVVADTPDWEAVMGKIHPNPYLRRYLRRQYLARSLTYRDYREHLAPGFYLERLTPAHLEGFENSDTVRHWAETWGLAHFFADGGGYIIRDGSTICAWSLTDCRVRDRAAIGIVVDARYRRRGLAGIVSAANADRWFHEGIATLEWLCVAANAGSQATARKLGFTLAREYAAYTTFPPYENDTDQTPEEWRTWDAFYRSVGAYREHPAEYGCVEARIARILS